MHLSTLKTKRPFQKLVVPTQPYNLLTLRFIPTDPKPLSLSLLRTLPATVTSRNISINTQLHVLKGNTRNLLGYNTAQKLGLITISVNTATFTDTNKNSTESLQEELKCVSGGVGKVRNKVVKLHVDPDVTPRQQRHRGISFHVRGDVEKELERLERLEIMKKVEGPTPWVSPVVVQYPRNLEKYGSVSTSEKPTRQ